MSCATLEQGKEAQDNAPALPRFSKTLPYLLFWGWPKKSWSLAPPAVQIGEWLADVHASGGFLFQAISTQFPPCV